jgi:hypothetical protein
MNNHSKFISLRRDYPKFVYESYAWEWIDVNGVINDGNSGETADKRALRISFVFKILDANGDEAFVFEPSVLLSLPFVLRYCESNSQIDTLIFNCGMVEMVSYWKATCSPITQVVCGILTDEQQAWWKRLFFNGLGEFFYINRIDADLEWFMRLQNPIGEEWIAWDCNRCAGKETTAADSTGVAGILDTAGMAYAVDIASAVSTTDSAGIASISDMAGAADVIYGADKTLVPVGGGKDSCVTLELLRKTDFFMSQSACNSGASATMSDSGKTTADKKLIPFIINPRGATEKCCARAGFAINDIAVMYRAIDPLLLEMNEHGFLNGHTPFSAMLAFYSTLAATLADAKYIALSNESSANEATVIIRGNACAKHISLSNESSANEAIVTTDCADCGGANHQYSKSFEFEQDFRWYSERFLFCNNQNELPYPEYFSLLRPLSEAHIAKIFSQYPQYFDVFKSCNVGSKTDIWCGHCAKCLFVYIILAPFLKPETLQKIFNGKNLLDDMSLQKEFDELVGAADVKPFECVGTVSEVNWALQHSLEKGALLNYYKTLVVSKIPQQTEKIFAINHNHAIPKKFDKLFSTDIST